MARNDPHSHDVDFLSSLLFPIPSSSLFPPLSLSLSSLLLVLSLLLSSCLNLCSTSLSSPLTYVELLAVQYVPADLAQLDGRVGAVHGVAVSRR
jgi:hypothetical protein